jgi:hypothetical protein
VPDRAELDPSRITLTHAWPVSAATLDPWRALGTQAGPTRIRDVAVAAGFRSFPIAAMAATAKAVAHPPANLGHVVDARSGDLSRSVGDGRGQPVHLEPF